MVKFNIFNIMRGPIICIYEPSIITYTTGFVKQI